MFDRIIAPSLLAADFARLGEEARRLKQAGRIGCTHAKRAAARLSFRIAIDGGVNRETAAMGLRAAADVLVSGTAFFRALDLETEIRELLELPARRETRFARNADLFFP